MKHPYHQPKVLWSSLLIALLCIAVSAWLANMGTINGLELAVFTSINGWSSDLRATFWLITQAGSEWMLFGLTLVLIALKRNRLALRLFATGTAAIVVSQILKLIIDRPRPFYLLGNVRVYELMRLDSGFPSTHAAVAAACALVIMIALPWRWRWVCWLWILIVGLSRIYLGVHAPLDVLAGWAIGVSVVSASLLVHGKLKTVRKITGLKLQR